VPANIDHFWTRWHRAVNQSASRSAPTRDKTPPAGFDPRNARRNKASTWAELPVTGLVKSTGLNYQALESASPVT